MATRREVLQGTGALMAAGALHIPLTRLPEPVAEAVVAEEAEKSFLQAYLIDYTQMPCTDLTDVPLERIGDYAQSLNCRFSPVKGSRVVVAAGIIIPEMDYEEIFLPTALLEGRTLNVRVRL